MGGVAEGTEEARTPQGLAGQGEDTQPYPKSSGRSSEGLSKVITWEIFHCPRVTLVQVWTMTTEVGGARKQGLVRRLRLPSLADKKWPVAGREAGERWSDSRPTG